MIERRQSARSRVIYSGVVGYNERQSTVECVIRNFSEDGAEVEFDNPAVLPDVIDLLIAKKNRAFTAKIAWRQFNKAGLAFEEVERDAPMPLDWVLRLRASRSEQRELQKRFAGLLSRHFAKHAMAPLQSGFSSSVPFRRGRTESRHLS